MNKFKLATVAATVALSFNAHADNIILNAVTGPVAHITYAGSSAVSDTVYAGQFDMTNTTQGIDFYAFCIDIFNHLQSPYEYGISSTNTFGWSALQEGRVNYLFDSYASIVNGDMGYTGVDSTIGSGVTATHAGAFQLALWEILNEKEDATIASLSDGLFQATSGNAEAINLADSMVSDVWANAAKGYISGTYSFQYIDGSPAVTGGMSTLSVPVSSQNLISFNTCVGECNPPKEVPEPAPLALIGLSLLGLGFITRKSQSGNNFAVSYA